MPFEHAVAVESYRPVGQDRADVFHVGDALVVVVADGAGGIAGGAEAADAVVAAVREAVEAGVDLRPRPWSDLLVALDRRMLASPEIGESTAVVVAVSPEGVAGSSVGDSAAWIAAPDRLLDLTAYQARKPFLGTGAARAVGFAAGPLAGTLLVASDGLVKYDSREDIARTARGEDLASAAATLIQQVRLPSGQLQDDVAVVLVRPVR